MSAVPTTEAVLVTTTQQRAHAEAEYIAKAFLVRYRVKHTRDGYALALRQWFGWCTEHFVDALHAQRSHIELFARDLEETGRKLATVAAKLNALAGFYKFAVIDGHLDRNPMDHVIRPSVERKSTSSMFTRAEVNDMLARAEASSVQDHALISVLAHNGLRISELLGIDLEHIADVRGQMAVVITRKGGNTQHITFAPPVAWAVKQLLDERPDPGPLFRTRTGRRMDRKAAALVVKRIAKAAGITKRAHPHAFRKTMATLSRNAGIPDREVIAAAGWVDSRMLGYYDGGKDTLQANATQALAVFLDRAV